MKKYELIKCLRDLRIAARNRRSVYCPERPSWTLLGTPLPAAVVMNMTGTIILNLIDAGLAIYEKPEKRRKWGRPLTEVVVS